MSFLVFMVTKGIICFLGINRRAEDKLEVAYKRDVKILIAMEL